MYPMDGWVEWANILQGLTVPLKVSCLLRFMPAANAVAHSLQFVWQCVFRFTPTANSIVHALQSRDGGLYYVAEKIRKFDENREQTDRQTENSITEATLIPCGSSGGAGQYIINDEYIHAGDDKNFTQKYIFSPFIVSTRGIYKRIRYHSINGPPNQDNPPNIDLCSGCCHEQQDVVILVLHPILLMLHFLCHPD